MAGAWLVLIGLQLFDSANAEGAAGAAEFFSAVLGATGGVMVAAVVFLGRAARHGSGRESADPLAVRRILLVLPALAVAAATLVSASIMLILVRGWLVRRPSSSRSWPPSMEGCSGLPYAP